MTARIEVVKLRKLNPDWTLETIGGETGITRQRVSQILHSEGLRAKSIYYGRNARYIPGEICSLIQTEISPLNSSIKHIIDVDGVIGGMYFDSYEVNR